MAAVTRRPDSPLYDCISSHDGCTKIIRHYAGEYDPSERAAIDALESAGLLIFVDSYRMQHNGEFIRRSTITPKGLASIGATRVLGMLPAPPVQS